MSQEAIQKYNKLQEQIIENKLQNEINFPQVVVVGEQSSGKSTLLNAISGKSFLPEGQEMKTRCPIIIQTTKIAENEPCLYKVNKITCKDLKDVRNKIEEINGLIPKSGISSNPIKITVKSPNVPTISLVDLPGLVNINLHGQSQTIVKEIEDLAVNYIKNPNNLILAVIPANIDVANSRALELARKYDKDGNRTMGIMTKMDTLVNKKSLDFLMGKMIEPVLKPGYFGVRCKDNDRFLDIDSEVEENDSVCDYDDIEEQKFFSDKKFDGIRDMTTVKTLRSSLENTFSRLLKGCFESVSECIKAKIEILDSRLEGLGIPFQTNSSDDEKRSFIIHQVNKFIAKFNDFLDNKNEYRCRQDDKKTISVLGGLKIRNFIENTFVGTLNSFKVLETISDYDIRAQMLQTSSLCSTISFDDNCFKTMLEDPINKMMDPSLECLDFVKQELEFFIKDIEIDEINPFKNFQKKMENSYLEILNLCKEITRMMILNHINTHSQDIDMRHPKFLKLIDTKYLEYKKEYQTKENFLNNKEEKIIENQFKKNGQIILNAPKNNINLDSPLSEHEKEILIKTKFYLDSYMSVALEDICSNIPRNIRVNFINQMRKEIAENFIQRVLKGDYGYLLEFDTEKMKKRTELLHMKNCFEDIMKTVKDP